MDRERRWQQLRSTLFAITPAAQFLPHENAVDASPGKHSGKPGHACNSDHAGSSREQETGKDDQERGEES
jgi:hypothetical protein